MIQGAGSQELADNPNKPITKLRGHVESGSSGELIVVADSLEIHLYLRSGRIAWASDSNRTLVFTHHLQAAASIDGASMQSVVEECQRENKKLFDTLVEWGLVTWQTIQTSLQSFLQSALRRIESAPEGQVMFLNRKYDAYNEKITFSLDELLPEALSTKMDRANKTDAKQDKEKNMGLDTTLTKAQQNVPECVAAGYVDMTTGMLLGVKTIDSHPQEVLDLVAAATADLFQGQNVTSIERLFRKARGQPESGDHYFKEVIVFSENLLHVFLRGKKEHNQAAVFVCRVSANIGMVLAKTRSALSEIEASV